MTHIGLKVRIADHGLVLTRLEYFLPTLCCRVDASADGITHGVLATNAISCPVYMSGEEFSSVEFWNKCFE